MRTGYYVISILGQVGQVVKLVNMNWFARIVKHYQYAYQANSLDFTPDSLYPICRLKGGWSLIHLRKWLEICQMPIKNSDSMNLFILR